MTSTVGTQSTHPKTMPQAHADLPVWNSENWFYEDFEIGLIRASYEVFKGEGELVLYCEHIQTVKYRDGKPQA